MARRCWTTTARAWQASARRRSSVYISGSIVHDLKKLIVDNLLFAIWAVDPEAYFFAYVTAGHKLQPVAPSASASTRHCRPLAPVTALPLAEQDGMADCAWRYRGAVGRDARASFRRVMRAERTVDLCVYNRKSGCVRTRRAILFGVVSLRVDALLK